MESASEALLANKTGKVTALITAESVIAGFMIAYAAINGQMLIHWTEPQHNFPVTTYIAGIVIYAIVLTCFVSILLLYESLDTEEMDDVRYKTGYGLFIWAIFLACAYVIGAAVSIYHFTVTTEHQPYPVPVNPWATVVMAGFFVYVVLLIFIGSSSMLTHYKARKLVSMTQLGD